MLTPATRARIEAAHEEGRIGNVRDSEFMVEQIASMRRAFLPGTSDAIHEYIAAWLICFIAPAKSDRFRASIEQVCAQFEGIADRPDLQLQFINCVRPAALFIQSVDDTRIQDASFFFDLPAVFPATGTFAVNPQAQRLFRQLRSQEGDQ